MFNNHYGNQTNQNGGNNISNTNTNINSQTSTPNKPPRFHFHRPTPSTTTASVNENQFGSSKVYQNYSYAAVANNPSNTAAAAFAPYKTNGQQQQNRVLKMRS